MHVLACGVASTFTYIRKHKLYYVPLIYKKINSKHYSSFMFICPFKVARGRSNAARKKLLKQESVTKSPKSEKEVPLEEVGSKRRKKEVTMTKTRSARRRKSSSSSVEPKAAGETRAFSHGKLIFILPMKQKFWFFLVSFMQWHKGRAEDWPDRVAKESKTEEPLDKIGSFIFLLPFLINTFIN